MALLGDLHLPSLQSRSHDISSICPSQKWSSSGGKVTSNDLSDFKTNTRNSRALFR